MCSLRSLEFKDSCSIRATHLERRQIRFIPNYWVAQSSHSLWTGVDSPFLMTQMPFSNINVQDAPLWDSINPGGIVTFNGDLSAFRNRGGKLLTYHGRRDPLISSTNSKRVYDLISHTLSLPVLDDFYRLFLIPGMGHCGGGLGAPSFGQSNGLNVVNASSHNILLALVDWVEGGIAPDTIIGSGANNTSRTHCRYPLRSVFNGTVFVCEV